MLARGPGLSVGKLAGQRIGVHYEIIGLRAIHIDGIGVGELQLLACLDSSPGRRILEAVSQCTQEHLDVAANRETTGL